MRRTLLLLCLYPVLSLAAETATEQGKLAVSPEVLAEFQAIEALSAQSNYAEAARKAEALLLQLKDEPAARALLLRNMASLYGLQKHYLHAASLLEQSLALRALPSEEARRAQLELSQYYLAAENYPRAASTLAEWIRQAPSPKPEQYLLLAELCLRLHQPTEATRVLEELITRAPEPKAEWYQQLLGLHHEQHQLEHCIRVLDELLQRHPDNALYWQQLAGIYQEAGQVSRVLAVQQLMYTRGLLRSEKDIVQLAQVLRYQGLPNRAAEILQREIDNGGIANSPGNLGLLADTWTEARELRKAAAALEASAALARTGETLHRLGQLYSELHDWGRARQALAQALSRGGLKNPGGAYLLLGMAYYRLNAKHEARTAFLQAQGTPAISHTAQQWLAHIDQESRSH